MTRPVGTRPPEQADAATAVVVERRGGVLLVVLNRPEARNAINMAVAEGWRPPRRSSTATSG